MEQRPTCTSIHCDKEVVIICGRYSCLTEQNIIEIRAVMNDISLHILHDDFDIRPGKDGEVRPTGTAPVIVLQGPGLVAINNLRWGFKRWDGKGVIINARVETLHEKDLFSKHLYVGRCVVPAGEYYEWERIGGKNKVKHFVKDNDSSLLFMAGLYREAADGSGREFVVITKDADENVGKIHDRMPVIMRADQIADWLTGRLSPKDIINTGIKTAAAPCDGEYVQLRLEV